MNHIIMLSQARLVAVQALYAHAFMNKPVKEVLASIQDGTWDVGALFDEETVSKEDAVKPDMKLLTKILTTYDAEADRVGDVLKGAMDKPELLDELDLLVLSILRAGVAEMMAQPTLDAPILINEYTDIARSFFDTGANVALVNAVLDKVAKGA